MANGNSGEDLKRAIVSAFAEAVAADGWFAVHPAALAEKAGVSLADMHALFPSKLALLTAFVRQIDEEALAEGLAEAEERARDRLFEVLMRRIDALQDRRAAVLRLMSDLPRDPPAALSQLLMAPDSMIWMLQAARIGTHGLEGAIKARALTVLFGLVLNVWREDESDDLSATMKALDQRLGLAEELANTFLPSARRRGPDESQDDGPAETG